MEVLLEAEHINAMAHLAGEGDIRPWINGVWVECTPRVTLLATTGHVIGLFDPDVLADQAFTVQIPRTVLNAMKRWRGLVRVSCQGGERWSAEHSDATLHWADEGLRMPDNRAAIPRTVSGEAACFDFALLERFQRVRKTLGVKGANAEKAYVVQNGLASAHVRIPQHPEFFGAVAPLRVEILNLPKGVPLWVLGEAKTGTTEARKRSRS